MAGHVYLNRKKNITNKLITSLFYWRDFETDNVELSIIGDDGWVLLYNNPIALFKRATRNKVHSINLEALTTCSKSRFFTQERLKISVMKDKKGLFLRTPFKEPTIFNDPADIITRLPDTLRWVYLGDLSNELFNLSESDTATRIGPQLPLYLPFKTEKDNNWFNVVDSYSDVINKLNKHTARDQLSVYDYSIYPTSAATGASTAWTTATNNIVSTGAVGPSSITLETAAQAADRYLRRMDGEFSIPDLRGMFIRDDYTQPMHYPPIPTTDDNPITDGDIPY